MRLSTRAVSLAFQAMLGRVRLPLAAPTIQSYASGQSRRAFTPSLRVREFESRRLFQGSLVFWEYTSLSKRMKTGSIPVRVANLMRMVKRPLRLHKPR